MSLYVLPAETVQHNTNTEASIATDPLLEQTFIEEPEVASMPAGTKFTYAKLPGDGMEDFLCRPRQIARYEWVPGTTGKWSSRPWYDFFLKPEVMDKFRYYSRFRGNLKIQFLINGSAFHRGVLYAGYLPMGDESRQCPVYFNDGVLLNADAYGIGAPFGAGYHGHGKTGVNYGLTGSNVGTRALVPLSQRQHVKLYPGMSLGGEMVLPFIFPHEYMAIDEAFFTTLNDMGELYIRSVGSLGVLGDNSTENVDITVYASVEPGYELAGPTTYVFQSGEAAGGSKTHTKVPSDPAQGGWLSMVAKYGPTVARAMGFTNPPLITDVGSVRIQAAPNLANSQLSARDEVLALHPETTLESGSQSLGGDNADLIISNIAQRESYLTSFSWPATGTGSVQNAMLFQSYVGPNLSPTLARAGGTSYYYDQVFTLPMDWVAQAFKFWRGDLIFGFEVVTTPFQKGRLKVSFDPVGTVPVAAVALNYVGYIQTKILDISENTKFEFTVPYMATTPWLKCASSVPHPQSATLLDQRNYIQPSAFEKPTETMPTYNSTCWNGVLNLQVLNTLTNDLDAYVIVTVRGAPNMEFAVPGQISDTISLQDQYYFQSGGFKDQYMGETVSSIKDLCNRSCPIGRHRQSNTNTRINQIPVIGVPRGMGFIGDSQVRSGSLYSSGGASAHTFYQWFSAAFAGARSSHRLVISNLASDTSTTRNTLVSVVRGNTTLVHAPFTNWNNNWIARYPPSLSIDIAPTNDSSTALNAIMDPANGASMLTDGGSVLVPYQSRVKFSPTNHYFDYLRPVANRASGTLMGEPIYPSITYNQGSAYIPVPKPELPSSTCSWFEPCDMIRYVAGVGPSTATTQVFTAAGPDMAFGPFLNAPGFFRSRRSGTFTYGSGEVLNSTVNTKMITLISASADPGLL